MTILTAVNEETTYAVKVAIPVGGPNKPDTYKLTFIQADSRSNVEFWMKMQFGQFAKLVWCEKVGA